jgi:hypothetical protein
MLHEEKVIIAQHRIPDDTNEITQVRELLENVDLSGAVVTADAVNAQRDTADYIAGPEEDGGRASDYLLLVKGNQPKLQRAVFNAIQEDCPAPPITRNWTRATAGSSAGQSGSRTPGTSTSARQPGRPDPARRIRQRRHPDQQGNRARRHQPRRRTRQRRRPGETGPRPVGLAT